MVIFWGYLVVVVNYFGGWNIKGVAAQIFRFVNPFLDLDCC